MVSGPRRNDEVITLPDAYGDLTPQGFSVWVRLHLCSAEEMAAGRGKLAQVMGFSEGRCNAILRELKAKGYVALHPAALHGQPTRVELKRRGCFVGRDAFVRLSSKPATSTRTPANPSAPTMANVRLRAVLHRTAPAPAPGTSQRVKFITEKSVQIPRRTEPSAPQFPASDGKPATLRKINSAKPLEQCTAPDEISRKARDENDPDHCSNGRPERLETRENRQPGKISEPPNTGKLVVKDNGRMTFEWDSSTPDESDRGTEANPPSTLVSRIKDQKEKKKTKSSSTGRRTRPAPLDRRAPVDLERLEKIAAREKVEWNPEAEEREAILGIMELPGANVLRQRTRERYAEAFKAIYEGYRRPYDPGYRVVLQETKHAAEAAFLCLAKRITPQQLVAFWHEHCGDFRGMKFPPLSFLASAAIVDQAACALSVERGGKRKKRNGQTLDVDQLHGFADTKLLHPRLRPGLLKAGFNLSDWPDDHLLTVQQAAEALAGGLDTYVSPSMKGMVDWAVDNLFTREDGGNAE